MSSVAPAIHLLDTRKLLALEPSEKASGLFCYLTFDAPTILSLTFWNFHMSYQGEDLITVCYLCYLISVLSYFFVAVHVAHRHLLSNVLCSRIPRLHSIILLRTFNLIHDLPSLNIRTLEIKLGADSTIIRPPPATTDHLFIPLLHPAPSSAMSDQDALSRMPPCLMSRPA